MKSVKLDGKGRVAIVDVPRPVPGPGEVLIRTRMSALCGSELKTYRGGGMARGNSGHEAVGCIEVLGEGVTSLHVGLRVGVSAICGCGRQDCPECEAGQSTWCPRKKFYGSMHAEYFVTAATGCLPLPDDVPDDVGVLVSGDGLGVPYHTSLKLQGSDVRSVAVFGLGPVGLGSVLLQAHLGRRVIAVDLIPERLEYARHLGAAHRIDAHSQDPLTMIQRLTENRGVDAAIEAAGVPTTAQQCFKAVRRAGLVVFNGEQGPVELSPSEDFIRRDIRAVGSWFFHVGEFQAMVSLLRRGLPVGSLITHTFPLDKAAEAFATFASGKAAKVLLDMRTDSARNLHLYPA